MGASNVKSMTGYLLLLATLTACGDGGFVAKGPMAAAQSSSSDLDSDSDETTPVDQLAKTPALGAAWLKESGFGSGNSLYFQTTVKVPFGWVYSTVSAATKFVSPLACQIGGMQTESNPYTAYASAELPCGRIAGGGLKEVMVATIDPYVDSKNGYTIQVNGANVPVYISRTQYSGVYKESRLDSRAVENITSSRDFAQDVSVRYEPNGSSMKLSMCAAVPGFDISAPAQSVHAKAYTRILGLKITEATDILVNVGQAHFDYVRGCFASEVSFNGTSFVPSVQFKTIEAPAFSNVTYSGLVIRFQDFWLRLLDKMLDFFKVGIRKKIQSVANAEVQKIIDQDLESGAWFTRLHGEATLNSMADKVNRAALKSMRSTGLPMSGEELKAQLKRQCQMLPLFEVVGAGFREACIEALNRVKVAIVPFYREPKQEALGCYSHYANIHSSRDQNGAWKWWAKQCGFAMQIQVQVDTKIPAKELADIQKLIASFEKLGSYLDLAQSRIGWGTKDQALLVLVLEEALKAGERVDSLDDLARVASRYRPVIEERLKGWGA